MHYKHLLLLLTFFTLLTACGGGSSGGGNDVEPDGGPSETPVIASPNDFEARTASSGVVVVTHASSDDRVDGFVFDLHLRSALGAASSFDFVPFRIPF